MILFHYQEFYRTANKFTKIHFFAEYRKGKSRIKLLAVSGRAPKFVNECNKDFMNHTPKKISILWEFSGPVGLFWVQPVRDTILTWAQTSKERSHLLYRQKIRWIVDLCVSSVCLPVRHPDWLSFDFCSLSP